MERKYPNSEGETSDFYEEVSPEPRELLDTSYDSETLGLSKDSVYKLTEDLLNPFPQELDYQD